MAGTSNISGDESIIFADNASFDGTERGGKLTTNGELWVGSTSSPHVKKGTISSPDNSIIFGYLSPNITAVVNSSSMVTSVSGTANRITSTGGNTPVIDISSSYVGQNSLTTLGTITSGTWNASVIPLAYGGTNANLTASNGGILYSTATAGAILSGTATANKVLMSGSSAAPSWSTPTFPNSASSAGTIIRADGTNWAATTATYPNTTTANQILYSSATNTVGGLTTANNAVVNTNGSGVPSMTTYPRVTGLGINASPGSTTGLTFDGTNFMSTYAQGTFTPGVSFGGLITGITYSQQVGVYIKIGLLVYMSIHITLTNKGSATGVAQVYNLPYGPDNTYDLNPAYPYFPINVSLPASCTQFIGYMASDNSNAIKLYGQGSSTSTQLSDTNFSNNSVINVTVIVKTTS